MNASHSPDASIDLYWIPLGAGGSGFVQFNGRVYERILAIRNRRQPKAIYHTALVVRTPEGRYVVETMWPSPDRDIDSRGVAVEGSVFWPPLARWRVFRYEVRRWRDGSLPDAGAAVGGAQRVSEDLDEAVQLLELVADVPPYTWGRDTAGHGEMWNSNSVISWLLATTGLPMGEILAPERGRAPGWDAGLFEAGA